MRIIRHITLVLMLFVGISTFAVNYPKYETRAVWLTTIGGLDWPHSYAQTSQSIKKQQEEFCNILNKLQKANINTILLQTRVRATTIFQSSAESGYEPWDGCLSGHPGTSPGYDALSFAIRECHKRGMEIHAWVVTIPVGKWNGYGCKQLRQKHGDMLLKIADEGYMNPSNPRVAPYLANYCADITRRYDIDGIHLDYIRYPEAMTKLPPATEGRKNITRIVTAIHDAVKAIKPWVKMSCSPIGKHDDTARFWSRGWNARSRVFQDAKEWMRQGLMDMEFPMMYFKGDNFYPFALDWKEGSYGKIMAPGLGIYFLDPREGKWNINDITREMYVLRQQEMGFCFFRSDFFTRNVQGLYNFVCEEFNRYPSISTPTINDKTKSPTPPKSIDITFGTDVTFIKWQGAKDRSNGDYLCYNIYTSDTYPVDITKAENLLFTRYRGSSIKIIRKSKMFYAITAINRYGQESTACQMRYNASPKDSKPGWYYVTHPLG